VVTWPLGGLLTTAIKVVPDKVPPQARAPLVIPA